jgi:hypothetical protein
MLNTFKNYEPAGPLGYLLMDKEGEMHLGLFRKIDENRLVLILKLKDDYYVLNPSKELLDGLFKNEKMVADMAYDPLHKQVTTLDNVCLSESECWSVYNYILMYMSGRLAEQRFFIVYPNYYYVYSEWDDQN